MLHFKVIEHGSQEYQESVKLRNIFLREPLGLSFSSEELASENDSYHVAAFDENERIIGSATFRPLSKIKLKMRQVVIDEGWQGRGIGRELIEFAEAFARSKGYAEIEANARTPVTGFYEKMGYNKIGKEFEEIGIAHFKVEKSI